MPIPDFAALPADPKPPLIHPAQMGLGIQILTGAITPNMDTPHEELFLIAALATLPAESVPLFSAFRPGQLSVLHLLASIAESS